MRVLHIFIFFFNDTATTEIYTLSLHDALPIFQEHDGGVLQQRARDRDPLALPARKAHPALADQRVVPLGEAADEAVAPRRLDRKSTRLNSSHANISYAVFCLKKKINT